MIAVAMSAMSSGRAETSASKPRARDEGAAREKKRTRMDTSRHADLTTHSRGQTSLARTVCGRPPPPPIRPSQSRDEGEGDICAVSQAQSTLTTYKLLQLTSCSNIQVVTTYKLLQLTSCNNLQVVTTYKLLQLRTRRS